MKNDTINQWTIKTIPTHNNPFFRLIQRMNKFGKLPKPFSFIAKQSKKKLISLLANVKNIDFNYDFFLLYGNIHGNDLVLSNAYILDYAPVYFGNHVIVGPDVKIITSWHPFSNFNQVYAKSIFIGDNVWIGMNVIVLPGVSIGKNSVIGAGAVVTKSIPENVLAAGNPCKVIKEIDRKYEWWNEVNK